jgi:hypothetical protein
MVAAKHAIQRLPHVVKQKGPHSYQSSGITSKLDINTTFISTSPSTCPNRRAELKMSALANFFVALSALFGWTYTFLWSASFYPQPLLNYRRKSTSGTTVDFPLINTFGAFSYSPSSFLPFTAARLVR